jgi:hypothetical protein
VLPNNQCLSTLLRIYFKANCFTAGALAHGYCKDVLVDLDTSALAPILAGFRYKAGCKVRSPEGKIKTLEALAKNSIDVQA